MPFLDKLPDSAQIIVGVVFMLLGCSFMYKAFLAMIRGKLTYWDGFLPLTLLSPFTIRGSTYAYFRLLVIGFCVICRRK